MTKALLLVDTANLYYFANHKFPESKIKYTELLAKAKKDADVTRSIAYGTRRDDRAGKFIDALQIIGFETRFKHARSQRSNNNVEIAMDIVRAKEQGFDTILLYSSDNDLASVLIWAREQKLTVNLFSFGFNPNLRNLAASHEELTESLLDVTAAK